MTRTNTITITPTTAADLPDLLTLWNDGRVMQWVEFPHGLDYDLDQMRTWFNRIQSQPHRHHFIVRDATGAFCGELYYKVTANDHRAQLDIKFVPEQQGRGLATHAFTHLIDHIFAHETDVNEVWVEPWPSNAAAQRLYARCGLQPRPRPPELQYDGPSYWSRFRTDPAPK